MFKQKLIQWHRQIGWGASIALFIWGISAIMHPAMSWFGPQAARSFPPSMQIEGLALSGMSTAMSSVPQLAEARVIKMVPSETGPLLQVTKNQQVAREYFDPQTMQPVPEHDRTQAEWLASYYTGQDRSAIQQLNFVTSFSDEYPEVNRLLPVYRVEFAGEDGIVAFIHTETGALASLSNNFKTNVQWLFQHLHTFKWLDSLESGRLITVAFFMLSLLATGVVGILLVFNLKSRKIPNTNRRYHRRLSYIAWLPLLAWSASGFYHLMQASLVETQFGLRLGEPYVALEAGDLNTDSLSQLSDESLNSLALVRNADQQLYWRASIARDSSQEAGDRAGRFAGNPSERAAMYLPATTSSTNTSFEDSQLAEFLALSFTGASADQVTGVSQIRGFGAGYDFRNKRLPVWKIDLNDEQGTSVFIDTATGILVDSNRAIDRAETWSFGILHKWNHLTGLTGPQIRDMLIVLTILMLLAINVFGIPLLLKKKPKKAAPAEVSPEQPVPA